MIANDIESQLDTFETKINIKTLSEMSGVAEATIRRILKRNHETNFLNLYLICNILFDDDTLIRWSYSFELPNNMKAAMEFMLLKNKLDDLDKYIRTKVSKWDNKSAKKWAKVYSIISEYERNPTDHLKTLKKIRGISGSDKELEILLKLVEANIFYRIVADNSSYLHEMSRLLFEIKDHIGNTKDFLYEAFSCRLNDLMSKNLLYVKSDVNKARQYAKKNIYQNICPLFKANALYLIGVSNMFESYEICLQYTKKAIDTYRVAGHDKYANDLERSAVPLIKAHFGVKYDEETKDLSEIAHYEAKWGDKQKSKKIINKLIEDSGETMYRLYYKGMAEENEEALFKSLTQFLKIGDNFFAQFPLNQLRRSSNTNMRTMAEMLYTQFIN
ncbi:AimR family lysis-lysogeny pheromone receptor [Cytobacillus solani]|uniref:HTH cro/C1-type domain-containing protein n=1 Tax=Cytobacillus solani TaxID=1637975 RepID=A0A0Q3VGH2_9BACI|nr:AimR family lysis-lysogeny pheromone receptor [Cytobacillus solani]KQL18818.1 hypothetical protein AN957_09700 [Cytobacillus solani]